MGFQVLAPVARTKSMLVCVCRHRERREKERHRRPERCANKASRTNDTETVSDKRLREKESKVGIDWESSLSDSLLKFVQKLHTKKQKKFVCAKQCLLISEFDALFPLLLTDFDVSFHLSFFTTFHSETTTHTH